MTFLLPLVALALALAAPFLARTERARFEPLRLGALVLLVLAAGIVVHRSAPAIDRTPAVIGLVLGALACAAGAWGGGLAFGVAAAGALHLLPAASLPSAGLALVAGTGLGALTVDGELSALAAVLVVAADDLGTRHSQVPAAAFMGSQVGVAVAVGALVAALLPKGVSLLRPIVVGLLALLGSLFVARGLGGSGLTLCGAIGAVTGVVLHLLMPNEEGESSRAGLAAVIGIALATVAFGLGRGAGMGLAAVAAVGVLLAVENRRAVLALGPLVGLVLYRVLREAGTGATRALDIGQHYTLLAIVLGLTLPLLPTDWLRGRIRVYALGSLLWGIAAVATPPLVVVALGMRGGIGFVVGLGVTGLVQAMRGVNGGSWMVGRDQKDERTTGDELLTPHPSPLTPSLLPLALGAGLAGGTILALAWLGDESTLTREAKVHLFAYAAVAGLVIAGALALVGRPKKESPAS